jgi:hypothetical protein
LPAVITSEESARDLAGLVVPCAGRLVSTDGEVEPYRLLDADGELVEQGQASGRCQVMWSRPVRAGRAATAMSSVRMVAPRATACRVEARVPSARVTACAVTASCSQAALALNWWEGRCASGGVDQVGEDLLDHGVAAMVGFGLGELEWAVGEHRVIAVGGE